MRQTYRGLLAIRRHGSSALALLGLAALLGCQSLTLTPSQYAALHAAADAGADGAGADAAETVAGVDSSDAGDGADAAVDSADASGADAADPDAADPDATDAGCGDDCDDALPCTVDSCDQGACVHLAVDTSPCDDGDACTVGDACKGATCVSGAKLACDDGNLCTDDACDKATGCVASANNAPCNDGSKCTGPDNCSDGACVGVKHIWQANLGSKHSDKARAVVALPDGGIAAAGANAWQVAEDFWLVRFDNMGKVVFDKTYGTKAAVESGHGLARAIDGGFFIVGTINNNLGDAYLVRTDAQGNEVWAKSYGSLNAEGANDVVALSNGGAAFIGKAPVESGTTSMWFVRVDAKGNTMANALIGTKSGDSGDALIAMPGGGFVLLGSTSVNGDTDAMVARVDDAGAELWKKILIDPDTTEYLVDLTLVPGGFAAVGNVTAVGAAASDIIVRRFDGFGTELWKQTYGDATAEDGAAIVALSDGLVIAGHRVSPSDNVSDGTLLRLDPNGVKLWQRIIDPGAKHGHINALARLANGFAMVGNAQDEFSSSGMWVMRSDLYGYTTCATSGSCTGMACGGFDPCIANWCESAAGCQKAVIADGAWCLNNACQYGQCSNKTCTGLKPVDCDDGNECSVDSCSVASGCKHATAIDGTPCGTGGFCKAGQCSTK